LIVVKKKNEKKTKVWNSQIKREFKKLPYKRIENLKVSSSAFCLIGHFLIDQSLKKKKFIPNV
jgi:hypothetical protein